MELIETLAKAQAYAAEKKATEGSLIAKRVLANTTQKKVTSAYFPSTDYGNAERLIHHHGQNLHWDVRRGKWLHWNNKYWEIDESGAVIRLAKAVARQIYAEAASIEDSTTRKEVAKYARSCESRAKILAMIELAKSLENITIMPDQLDKDPWKLNVQNGTINLKTGQIGTHKRDDLITKILPVAYDPSAKCPTWLTFLDRIMGGDTELIRFLQKGVGYSLTGSTSEQCLLIIHGNGANGKSVFLSTIASLLGAYATQTPVTTLMVKRNESIPNDIARLKGARFVAAVEAEEGQRLAESAVKRLTGIDLIPARFLHQEFFDFIPEFKIWLATNHRPQIRGTDHAIWRRIRLIPFNVTIPDEERDLKLTEKLLKGLPGILSWAIEGCKLWQEEGLIPPKIVVDATSGYREQSDAIGVFIEEECTVVENFKVMSKSLFGAYVTWCEENEEHPLNKRQFSQRIVERGFPNEKSTGGWYFFKGIGLTHHPL